MRSVFIYVEGRSDVEALSVLFAPLMESKRADGVDIRFIEEQVGHKKKGLLLKKPVTAARIINNDPHAVVAIVPDLYPPNVAFPHTNYDELRKGIEDTFLKTLEKVAPGKAELLKDRFRVFCFKHDLEALLLACPDALRAHLGADRLDAGWTTPVEDQNHGLPPKRIVETLFKDHGQAYDGVADAPRLLAGQDRRALARACPQCFQPFVEFLETL